MQWKDIKERIKKEEKVFIVAMGILLSLAIIDEIIVKLGGAKLFVLNYDAVSLVIIQIQATVQTLSIALLALASGKMNKSYMGIGYNNFQFNIRPFWFSQKRIITGSVILLIVNVFLHMAELYNAVVAVFIVVCLLIIISVREIYAVFTNGASADEEIYAYLLSYAEDRKDTETVLEMFKVLCIGWRETGEAQSELQYEKYLKVYKALFDVLIFDMNTNSQKEIEKETSEIIKCFSKAESKRIKERSLSFLNEYYEYLWTKISWNKEKAQAVKNGTHVLYETYYEITDVISMCSIHAIERSISFCDFVEYCVLCNYWFGYEQGQCYELGELADFVRNMGYQIGKKQNQDYTDKYWGELLENIETKVSVWPENLEDQADATFCNIKFQYAQMLINVQQMDLLKAYFYDRAVRHMSVLKTSNQVKLFLKVHCYLFYLAYYERTDCISEELKEAADKLLVDTQYYFKYGLDRIVKLEDSCDSGFVFNESLTKNLWYELKSFEYYPKNGDGKKLILDSAVEDFVVFSAVYLANRYHRPYLMSNIVSSENIVPFYMRYSNNEYTSKRLQSFLKCVCTGDKNPKYMLSSFEKILKEQIKKNQVIEAAKEYEKYSNCLEINSKEKVSNNIMNFLNQMFNDIISEDAKSGAEVKIPVLKINGLVDMSLEEIFSDDYDRIAENVISNLCSILCQTGAVENVSKGSFADDLSYLEFLKSQNIALIIGSDVAIKTKEYSNEKILESILEGKKHILEGYSERALLLEEDSVHIYIQSVKIRVHSGVLGEQEFSYDSSTHLYTYKVLNGIPIEFTKEELKKYLHDKRKVVDIVLNVCLKKKTGKIGYILVK